MSIQKQFLEIKRLFFPRWDRRRVVEADDNESWTSQ
jgi:hypothetical protein